RLLLGRVQIPKPLGDPAREEDRDREGEDAARSEQADGAAERASLVVASPVDEAGDLGLQRRRGPAEVGEELLAAEHVGTCLLLAEQSVGAEGDLPVEVPVQRADVVAQQSERDLELGMPGGELCDLG